MAKGPEESKQVPHRVAVAPLSAPELAGIAVEIESSFEGARLQDSFQTNSELGLAFHHRGASFWLWFDLDPRRPLVVRLPGEKPPARRKLQRPLTLFLKARFVGRRLKAARAENGRILVLSFHRGSDEAVPEARCEIEVRLIPHGQNVIAHDGRSSVAEMKPKELPESSAGASDPSTRIWSEIEEAWRALQTAPTSSPGGASSESAAREKDWRKQIEKKEKAVERMREELALKTSTVHSQVGEWLKANGNLDVPEEWREHISFGKSLAWNIEQSFHRAKENARKSEGTRARLAQVERELTELKERGPAAAAKNSKSAGQAAPNLLSAANARGRRFELASDLEVFVGKSAADNLALLRRAQPFDYWLHLREQPGSHAILRRTRSRQVTDAEFATAGRWVVEQSVKKHANHLKGERFELLIVECRYVRPIKGDKIGRVNYTNDRVMVLRF